MYSTTAKTTKQIRSYCAFRKKWRVVRPVKFWWKQSRSDQRSSTHFRWCKSCLLASRYLQGRHTGAVPVKSGQSEVLPAIRALFPFLQSVAFSKIKEKSFGQSFMKVEQRLLVSIQVLSSVGNKSAQTRTHRVGVLYRKGSQNEQEMYANGEFLPPFFMSEYMQNMEAKITKSFYSFSDRRLLWTAG